MVYASGSSGPGLKHSNSNLVFFFPFFSLFFLQSQFLAQPTDTVVTDQGDIERPSVSTLPVDPYQFRDGIVSDEEIAGLRRRNKGKAVAKYQLRQNDVCICSCSNFRVDNDATLAHFGLAQTDGGAH